MVPDVPGFGGGGRVLQSAVLHRRLHDRQRAPFTRREPRRATGLGDSRLKVHPGRLVDLEYVATDRAEPSTSDELVAADHAYGTDRSVQHADSLSSRLQVRPSRSVPSSVTRARERLEEKGHEKLEGLLRAGDPNGDVATVWEASEAVRAPYAHADPELALEWVTQLGHDHTPLKSEAPSEGNRTSPRTRRVQLDERREGPG